MTDNILTSILGANRKWLFTLTSLFAACSPVALAQSESNVIDEVIWVVGDEAIFKSEVEEAILDAQMSRQPISGDPYIVIPEQLAVQKLFLHQAALDSVEVTDAQVFQNVDERMNVLMQTFGSKERMEANYNMTSAQIREKMYVSLRDQMMVSSVQKNLTDGIKVTPSQVRNYFKNVPEDSIPYIPTKVEVELFVRKPVISQEEIDRVKDEMRDYTERVNSGKDRFSTLAVMYSEDGSASRGGEIGFLGRAELDPAYAAVAFNLNDTKTVSKIVESEFGFHIIQLIEKRGDRINTRHILRKARPTDEAIETCIHFVDSVCNAVRKGEFTFEEALPYLSDDKETRNNYGILPNTYAQNQGSDNYGTSKFEMKELPTEIARAVADMEIGEISKPFLMIDKKGKEVVAAVKLKNKINGHRATLTDDYQVLQNVLRARKCDEMLDKWIKEKQKTTYIRINEKWRNGEFQYPGWVK
ncbi:MAG: peptidylprolyl isomerase [Bacteroidaceae bacterium]|nr:peptidylprolyl isomerase [Bacteroidaceae bacterium]